MDISQHYYVIMLLISISTNEWSEDDGATITIDVKDPIKKVNIWRVHAVESRPNRFWMSAICDNRQRQQSSMKIWGNKIPTTEIALKHRKPNTTTKEIHENTTQQIWSRSKSLTWLRGRCFALLARFSPPRSTVAATDFTRQTHIKSY